MGVGEGAVAGAAGGAPARATRARRDKRGRRERDEADEDDRRSGRADAKARVRADIVERTMGTGRAVLDGARSGEATMVETEVGADVRGLSTGAQPCSSICKYWLSLKMCGVVCICVDAHNRTRGCWRRIQNRFVAFFIGSI